MPWLSDKQRRFAHTEAGQRAGFTPERIAQWDAETAGKKLPERAPKRKKKVAPRRVR